MDWSNENVYNDNYKDNYDIGDAIENAEGDLGGKICFNIAKGNTDEIEKNSDVDEIDYNENSYSNQYNKHNQLQDKFQGSLVKVNYTPPYKKVITYERSDRREKEQDPNTIKTLDSTFKEPTFEKDFKDSDKDNLKDNIKETSRNKPNIKGVLSEYLDHANTTNENNQLSHITNLTIESKDQQSKPKTMQHTKTLKLKLNQNPYTLPVDALHKPNPLVKSKSFTPTSNPYKVKTTSKIDPIEAYSKQFKTNYSNFKSSQSPVTAKTIKSNKSFGFLTDSKTKSKDYKEYKDNELIYNKNEEDFEYLFNQQMKVIEENIRLRFIEHMSSNSVDWKANLIKKLKPTVEEELKREVYSEVIDKLRAELELSLSREFSSKKQLEMEKIKRKTEASFTEKTNKYKDNIKQRITATLKSHYDGLLKQKEEEIEVKLSDELKKHKDTTRKKLTSTYEEKYQILYAEYDQIKNEINQMLVMEKEVLGHLNKEQYEFNLEREKQLNNMVKLDKVLSASKNFGNLDYDTYDVNIRSGSAGVGRERDEKRFDSDIIDVDKGKENEVKAYIKPKYLKGYRDIRFDKDNIEDKNGKSKIIRKEFTISNVSKLNENLDRLKTSKSSNNIVNLGKINTNKNCNTKNKINTIYTINEFNQKTNLNQQNKSYNTSNNTNINVIDNEIDDSNYNNIYNKHQIQLQNIAREYNKYNIETFQTTKPENSFQHEVLINNIVNNQQNQQNQQILTPSNFKQASTEQNSSQQPQSQLKDYFLELSNNCKSLEIKLQLPIKFEDYRTFLQNYLKKEDIQKQLYESLKTQLLSIFSERYVGVGSGVVSTVTTGISQAWGENPYTMLKYLIEVWKKIDISYDKRYSILNSLFKMTFSDSMFFLNNETALLTEYYHSTCGVINLIKKKENLKYEGSKNSKESKVCYEKDKLINQMNEEIIFSVLKLKNEKEIILLWNGIPYEYVSFRFSF